MMEDNGKEVGKEWDVMESAQKWNKIDLDSRPRWATDSK